MQRVSLRVGFSSCVLHGLEMSDSGNSLLMALGQFVIILDPWGRGKVLHSFTLLPFSYFCFYIFVTLLLTKDFGFIVVTRHLPTCFSDRSIHFLPIIVFIYHTYFVTYGFFMYVW